MPRKKKHREPEYSLHVFRHMDDRTRKSFVVFLVQTVKVFTSFNYEILLDVAFEESAIRLKIMGLRTTPLIMPGMGPAIGWRECSTLRGSYVLHVIKLNGETNEFRLDVTPSHIIVDGMPESPFIVASNSPVPFRES